MSWLRALTKDFIKKKWSSHCPFPCNCPLRDIVIALATFAIAHILARHPCRHHHCPLCRRRHCLPATLVTVSIALPLSPSLMLATLIAIAILLIVACHSCCRHHRPRLACPAPSSPLPLLLPPLPSPSSLLATLVVIAIALFVASAFTCLPPLLPSCRLG
jgi:hypothetical protein